jgi:hypothetical protein
MTDFIPTDAHVARHTPMSPAALAAIGVAHQIRDAFQRADKLTGIERDMGRPLADAPDAADRMAMDILSALKTGPLRGFDIRTAAVVEGAAVEAQIIVKYDGQVRHLTPLDSAALACVVRLEPGLRGASVFADAFRMAAIEASAKVDAVHAWSRGIRPTEDAE